MQQDAVARHKALSDEEEGLCSICMDRPLEAQIAGCEHQVGPMLEKEKEILV